MRLTAVPILVLCTLAVYCQQGPTVATEPEYRDQYTALAAGKLLPLERETTIVDTQSRRNFVITPSTSTFQTIRGPASPVRVSPEAHFYVKMSIGDRDPSTVIYLRKLVAGKNDRRLPFITIRGSLIPFVGPKHERAADDTIPFNVQKYGAESLEIIPTVPLTPGEYAFINANQAQCFGVDAGSVQSTVTGSGSAQPGQSTNGPGAPVKPTSAWRLESRDNSNPYVETQTAVLTGTVEAHGRRYASMLSMGCTVSHFSSTKEVTGNLPVKLEVPRFMSDLLVGDFSCEGDGATGSPSVYTEVGSQAISVRNACFDEDVPSRSPTSTISIGLTYEPVLVKSILSATGDNLVIHIRTEPAGADKLLARFSLPQQASSVQALLTPCIDLVTAARQKEIANTLVACPVIDNAVLSEVTVVTGPKMKALLPDPDNDIGKVWGLVAPRGNQVQPKRQLVCGYKSASGALTEKKTISIPSTARTCVFRTDDYTNAPFGSCSR